MEEEDGATLPAQAKEETGKISSIAVCNPNPLPDLNSQVSSMKSEGVRGLESGEGIPDSYDQSEMGMTNHEGRSMHSEIEATIEMGKELGVNINTMEDMIRMVIEGGNGDSIGPMNCLSLNCRGLGGSEKGEWKY
ncbi:hypothetical protein L1987_28125 [Smallanthus sonchifolius]|uniref:Uncharacterized protein n=1 Tax=Smallanthus sonchifolius TaxID=185202 RepID=A0ACB9IDL8_9ASTR|nr:hypothetical protein L1987_28125 [Smallanthus sonchifolius]